jgi:hypothetical protein
MGYADIAYAVRHRIATIVPAGFHDADFIEAAAHVRDERAAAIGDG